MVSAAATVDDYNGAVAIIVDWTSSPTVTGTPCLVNLYRVTPDGVQTPVRGSPLYVSRGTAIFWDDEAPLNTVIYYITSSACVTGTAQSSTVTIVGSGGEIGWLKDPLRPDLDVKLNFSLRASRTCLTSATGVGLSFFGDELYDDRDGEFPVIGFGRPVTIAQVRGYIESTLRLTSLSPTDMQNLRNIIASGRILFLQVPTDYGWAIDKYGSDYIHVRDVTMKRPTLPNQKHDERTWDMPFAVTNAPPNTPTGLVGGNGIGVGRSTYQDMKDSGLTYLQLKNTNKTYLQLAQGQGY